MPEGADNRGGLEFAVSPRSHLWVAACLATAGAALGAASMLGLGEILYATKQLLLEALFQAG
ncbi:MAG: hypothetical protein KC933_32575 [Myxococcales bacterium]|nr:hypothetical protein [Myxococcales bacterium]MCB9650343.1 hypothetical protein [Deltaproteobacteria bacterium]